VLFPFFIISLLLSIASGFASQFIYFVVIRKTLTQSNIKLSFDWLPHKLKAHIDEYNQIVKGNKSALMWGKFVIWLDYFSWIFLAVDCLLIFFVI